MKALDDGPVATLIAIAVIVVVVIGYISDDLSLEDALLALGAGVGGAGVLGVARAQSGKGIKKP